MGRSPAEHKDITPLLLSLFLLGGIVFLAFFRYKRGLSIWPGSVVDLDAVFSGLYVLWVLAEAPVAGRDAKTEGKATLDAGTCRLYALGQGMTFLSALWLPSVWNTLHAAHVAGIAIFLCGIGFRLWAIRSLGQFYSHRVRRVVTHRIVDTGPYRFLRHPAYAGMIVANIGICVYFFNWVTLCLFLLVLVPAIVFRIFVEEGMLYTIEGYADFAQRRKRLVPMIW